ncbi:hypothetical protein PhCBS80983_g00206 [Powellomyces hirtus]|uniref:Ras-GEF domain-containing protein n=1 Tax=Powellomyces hirtus TaxID=109895 RepID=A0A507EHP3_9FUNG|nr:hypothetical protein PhCBS80983_g00206 [Powellomyces hirtus]
MVRESSAQLLVKRALGGIKSGSAKNEDSATNSRTSLMFSAGPQQADVMTEFLALQSGVGYFAQPTASTAKYCNNHESVYIKIDLLGVHICENESRDSLIVEFTIEEIVKYSQNRGKKRFSFSQMGSAGLVREFKFLSEQYFEIFEALGRAIAVVIKIKSKTAFNKPTKADNPDGSLGSLREADEGHDGGSSRNSTRMSASSRDTAAVKRKSRASGHQARSLGELFSRSDNEASQQPVGEAHATVDATDIAGPKATLAKYYIESRYHNRSSEPELSKPDDDAGPAITPPATRKWKNQIRYDYLSISKARSKSENVLDHHSSTANRDHMSTASRLSVVENQSNRASVVSVCSTASANGHMVTTSEPFLSVLSRQSSRPSVLSMFKENGTIRPRSKSERPALLTVPLKDVERAVSIESIGSAPDKEKFGSASFKRMASKISLKKKALSSVWPAKESRASSVDVLTDDTPKVIVTKDKDGKETLIKNRCNNGYVIIAGTVEALIGALLNEPDFTYLDTFLLTFRHFLSPNALMQHLTSDFRRCHTAPREQDPGGKSNEEQMFATVTLIKKWVGQHAYDFMDTSTMCLLQTFLELLQSTKYVSYSGQIRSLVQHEIDQRGVAEVAYPVDAPSPPHELITLLREFDFLAQSSRSIAQQLTLVDSKLFRAIQPEEFTAFIWDTSPMKTSHTANLQTYINRFNRVGFWVATVICSYEEREKRTEALEMFIKIATKSMESGNFNTAMAILSGLNTTPVSRLKKSFAQLPSRATTAYEELEAKLSYRSNYKAYRELEHHTKPPLLPFFGLIIKDLTFLNDGNQKILANGLVNFEKMREVWTLISGIRDLQRGKFPWPQDDEIIIRGPGDSVTLHSYCMSPPCLTEEQLLGLSKVVEPQDPTGGRTISRHAGKSSLTNSDVLLDTINGKNPPPLEAAWSSGRMSISSAVGSEFATSVQQSIERDLREDAEGPTKLTSVILEYDAKRRDEAHSKTPPPITTTTLSRAERRRSSATDGKSPGGRRLSEKTDTFRRKLSEGGLGVVLGWWKKEDEEAMLSASQEASLDQK